MQDHRSLTDKALPAMRVFWPSDDVLGEIQATLAALADLDCNYQMDQEQMKQGADAARHHLYIEREKRYQQEREPYIQRLNQLEQSVRSLTSCL